MTEHILSIFPRGLFGRNRSPVAAQVVERVVPMEVSSEEESGRKRTRDVDSPSDVCEINGNTTPHLISRRASDIAVPSFHGEEYDARPVKRFRGLTWISRSPLKVDVESPKDKPEKKLFLTDMSDDTIAHCLSFLNSTEDRHAIQCTSKQFRQFSNASAMMTEIRVGGDPSTGLNGILQEEDTPGIAVQKLIPFVVAGNLEAMYMLGIIQSYCLGDVKNGVRMLKISSSQGHIIASYALGVVLRETKSGEASKYMKMAADAGYLPALYALLSALEMKEKFGEPDGDELRRHLDQLCLNRLLSRHYICSPDLRNINTSHCWNPLCGRWALKSTVPPNEMTNRAHRPLWYRHHDSMRANESLRSIRSGTNESTESGSASQEIHTHSDVRVSRLKMCSLCSRAKYCSKMCQVYDWRSGRHKTECAYLRRTLVR